LYIASNYLSVYLLQSQGRGIKWAHLIELNENAVDKSGLYIVGSHLKREHLSLTVYSHMNVRLAAQVCASNFLGYEEG